MGTLASDLRHAVRLLLRNPGFTFVAVAALALGIGANTAIFSVVNAVLLRPLPYSEPDRLLRLHRSYPSGVGTSISIPKFMAWKDADAFEAMAAYDQQGPGLNLSGGDRPEQVKGIHVSVDYFRVFGARFALGRSFTRDEDRPGGPRVAVVSYSLWHGRFGGDPAIVGRSIVLNDDPYTVVGVLAEGFRPDPPAEILIPLQPDPNTTNQGHYLAVAGRLKSGATIETARAQLAVLADQFRQRMAGRWMDEKESAGANLYQESLVRDARPAILVLAGAVGLVLLIACANVANLLLARAAVRQREMAIRTAIGASRGRIIAQLLTESVVLAGTGAVIGLVVGVWGVRALLALSPGDIPRASDLSESSIFATVLDWRVLVFTLGVSMLTGILFGLFPALQISKPQVSETLKENSGRGATSRRQNRIRGVLVALEIALALVLLVGASLLVRTFVGLRSVAPGFDAHNVLTMRTSLAGEKYATTAKVENLTRQVLQRIEGLPGVEVAATAITVPPVASIDLPFRIEGRQLSGDSQFHGSEQWRSISPHYFKALRIPLARGRVFEDRDGQASLPIVVINGAMARKFWKDQDPIGQQVTIGKGLGPEFDDPPRTIVGIVADVHENGLDQPAPPVMYVPAAQLPDALTRLANSVVPLSWVVRGATMNPATFIPSIQREFLAVDSQLPVSNVQTMEQVLSESIARQNFNMLLLGIFSAIAVALAAIGVYGVMAYSVEQRRREIGIRMALGAARADVLKLVVGNGLRLAAIGVAAGVVGALGLTRLLTGFLFGVGAQDPATFVLGAFVLVAIALVASYVPALRAARVDSTTALRSE